MIRYVLVFFVLCTIHGVHGQSLFGTVLSEDGNPVSGATIKNITTLKQTISNDSGEFRIEISSADIITIEYIGLKTYRYIVPELMDRDLNHDFVLGSETNVLDVIDVSSDRIKPVSVRRNENILDYEFDGKYVITLTTFKRGTFLNLEGYDTLYHKHHLNIVQPKSLYTDCNGQLYLVCKDSAFAVRETATSFEFSVPLSIQKFKDSVQPMVYKDERIKVFEDYTKHNQKYTLHNIESNFPVEQPIFEIWDKEAESVARNQYRRIIALYYGSTTETTNLIENKAWDGNMIALAETDTLVREINWYLNIRAKPLNIHSFNISDTIYCFDMVFDSLYLLLPDGRLIQNNKLFLSKQDRRGMVLMDRETSLFYVYYPDAPIISVKSVDTKTGIKQQALVLGELTFPEKLKIHNGYAYFLKNQKNGFHKLYRVKLK